MKRRAINDFCADAASTTPSPGLFWKKMKPLLTKSKSNIDGSADIPLLDNGQLIPNPSNVLNDFFASPRIQESVLNLTEEDFSDHPSIATIKNKSYLLDFTFTEIKMEVIIDNLLKLNPKKATGHDGLSPKILKLSTAALATPLTNLFNYCIRTSTLPSDWKMSNVTPIHKKDEVSDKNNYRPVSVLPAISKLFQKVMFDQPYASFAPILSSNMSGFLKGHSCATFLCSSHVVTTPLFSSCFLVLGLLTKLSRTAAFLAGEAGRVVFTLSVARFSCSEMRCPCPEFLPHCSPVSVFHDIFGLSLVCSLIKALLA